MKNQKVLVIVFLVAFAFSASAQLVIDGQFRTRFQTLHGYKKPVKANTEATFGFDQRSRLGFNYSTKAYSTRFTLQDARVWGAEDMYNPTGTHGSSYSLGLYEAWVDLKLGKKSSLRIGRQEWNYNDMRILCWRNWWTTGLAHDGLLYKRHDKEKGLFLDIGVSYNNEGGGTGVFVNEYPNRIKTMNFVNIKKVLSPKLSASFLSTASGIQDTSFKSNPLLMKGTHGIFVVYNKGKKATNGVFGNFSAYYQHGTHISRVSDGSKHKQISAHLILAEVGFRTVKKKLEISTGFELVSGNDGANTTVEYNDVQHSFNLQYGGCFPFYGGNINYFIKPNTGALGTKGGGLMAPYLYLKYKVSKKSMVDLKVWFPSTANNVYKGMDSEGNRAYYDKPLGTNFDLHFFHKFSKEVIWKSGFTYAMVSDTKNHMVYGYNANASEPNTLHELGHNYLFWTMIIVKPTFFNSAKK